MDVSNFSYLKFVSQVDVERLIEKNVAFEEAMNHHPAHDSICILCGCLIAGNRALRLSNGDYVCKTCFQKVQFIRYPEKYQTLYVNYLSQEKAWNIARHELYSKHPIFNQQKSNIQLISKHNKSIGSFIALIFGSIYLSVLVSKLFVIGLLAGIVGVTVFAVLRFIECNRRDLLLSIAVKMTNEWNRQNPCPSKPELKEFLDPTAELTGNDLKILHIFDYWPGYPPYWRYIRVRVLERDKNHCQISGCPSRTQLHVHHNKPIREGGSHKLENLVCLCQFHHGLQPEYGHERVWSNIRYKYFTMVRAHYRAGSFVRASIRRRFLIDDSDIRKISNYYSFSCPECDCHSSIVITIDYHNNIVHVNCTHCKISCKIEQKLAEETGPLLAELLKVNANAGRKPMDWSLITAIKKPVFVKSQESQSLDIKYSKNNNQLTCPRCGMRLNRRKGKYGKFLGCSGYPACNYTSKLR